MNWATMYVVTITSILVEKDNFIRKQQSLMCKNGHELNGAEITMKKIETKQKHEQKDSFHKEAWILNVCVATQAWQ